MDQSRLSTHFAIGGFTDCEEKGSRRFQIFDVVDVATGETKDVRTPPPARFALLQPPLGSAHESWSSNDSFAHGPEVLAALAVPDAPHLRKS